MRAELRRMGTKERVGSVTFDGARVSVDAPLPMLAPLVAFFAQSHVVPFRTELGTPREQVIDPGSEEHFALRLEALPAIGYFVEDVSRAP